MSVEFAFSSSAVRSSLSVGNWVGTRFGIIIKYILLSIVAVGWCGRLQGGGGEALFEHGFLKFAICQLLERQKKTEILTANK